MPLLLKSTTRIGSRSLSQETEETRETVARDDSLYRATTFASPNGGFLIDAANNSRRVTVEQFAPAVGGAYSCCLVSLYMKHKNDPWSVFTENPNGQNGPLIPGSMSPFKNTVIKFRAHVLERVSGFEAFLTSKKARRDYFDKEDNPTTKQTWSCGHVNVESLSGNEMTDKEKIRFVEAVNAVGWSIVLPGKF